MTFLVPLIRETHRNGYFIPKQAEKNGDISQQKVVRVNGRFHTAETLHCTVKSSWSILPFLDTTLAIPSAEVGAEADDLENVHAQT